MIYGVLCTPPLPEGGLPGVTREAVIELARDAGMKFEEKRLPSTALEEAEEIFLTNTSWEVLPVSRVDHCTVGEGKAGPMARKMLAAYRDLVHRETLSG